MKTTLAAAGILAVLIVPIGFASAGMTEGAYFAAVDHPTFIVATIPNPTLVPQVGSTGTATLGAATPIRDVLYEIEVKCTGSAGDRCIGTFEV